MKQDGYSLLVVEDDRSVLSTIVDTLAMAGYAPQATSDPGEALRLIQRQRFDVLISDVIMPGVGGAELAAAAERQNPDVRVILISGYPHTDPPESLTTPHVKFLRKPFGGATLLEHLRDALPSPPG